MTDPEHTDRVPFATNLEAVLDLLRTATPEQRRQILHPYRGDLAELGLGLVDPAAVAPVVTLHEWTPPEGLRLWQPGDPDLYDAPHLSGSPELGDAAFHGPVGRFLHALPGRSEAHPPSVGLHLWARVAVLAGGRAVAIGNRQWTERLNLYALVVGRSGRGAKGFAARLANDIYREVADLSTAPPLDLASPGSGEVIVAHFKKATDPRLLLRLNEFEVLLRKGSAEHSALMPTLTLAYDPEPLSFASLMNGEHVAERHELSIAASTTPAALAEHLPDVSIRDGFLNRFMVSYSQGGHPLPNQPDLGEHRAAVVAALAELDKWLPAVSALRPLEVTIPQRGPVRRRWDALYIDRRYGIENDPVLPDDLTPRYLGQALKLAALYALVDRRKVLTVEHINAGVAWADYSMESLRHVLTASQGLSRDARRLLDEIRKHPNGISRRALANAQRMTPYNRYSIALNDLERRGHIAVVAGANRVEIHYPTIPG